MENTQSNLTPLADKLLPDGPWSLREEGEANQWAVLTPDGKWLLSIRMNGEMMEARQRVIGHLIAASPDLLLLACQYLSDLRFPPTGDSLQRRIERAEAIIAKVGRGA